MSRAHPAAVASPIVLATSNGTGMGHLARQNAVAYGLLRAERTGHEPARRETFGLRRERGDGDPERRPTSTTAPAAFFSLSTAVHVIAAEGWPAEYCPSHHRGWLPHLDWHRYLGDRLQAFLDQTGARVLAFDGVAPYLGLLRMRSKVPDVAFVWVRRGMWRPEANHRLLRLATLFDRVVEPGDFAAEADRGPSATAPAERIRPVSMLSALSELAAPPVRPSGLVVGPGGSDGSSGSESVAGPESVPGAEGAGGAYGDGMLDRRAAAAALGLDPDRPTALVTLGAGTINDTTTPQSAAISTFLSDPQWQVAVTKLPLAGGGGLADEPRVRVLRDVYPLARYLSAFDAAVGAGGYNTVHELLPARIPTVLVPNVATSTDDQVARVRWATEAGMALYAGESAESVTAGVTRLLDSSVRAELRAACGTLPAADGADQLAAILNELTTGFAGASRSWRVRAAAGELAAKELTMRALGGSGVRLVRRMLGRNPPPVSTGSGVPPVVTDRLDPEQLRGDVPIEHVLPGGSEAYRTRREQIISRYYSAAK